MPVFGGFEAQYSEYGPRIRRKRALTTPERRRQSMPYALLARISHQPTTASVSVSASEPLSPPLNVTATIGNGIGIGGGGDRETELGGDPSTPSAPLGAPVVQDDGLGGDRPGTVNLSAGPGAPASSWHASQAGTRERPPPPASEEVASAPVRVRARARARTVTGSARETGRFRYPFRCRLPADVACPFLLPPRARTRARTRTREDGGLPGIPSRHPTLHPVLRWKTPRRATAGLEVADEY